MIHSWSGSEILWNAMVHRDVHKSSPMDCIPNQIRCTHSQYMSVCSFNIIIPLMMWHLNPFHQVFRPVLHEFFGLHVCYVPCPICPCRFNSLKFKMNSSSYEASYTTCVLSPFSAPSSLLSQINFLDIFFLGTTQLSAFDLNSTQWRTEGGWGFKTPLPEVLKF
jgi:hypothetical protein